MSNWIVLSRSEASRQVLQMLEAGKELFDVVQKLKIAPGFLVAALARVGLDDETDEGPTLHQTTPAHPRLEAALKDEFLARIFPQASRANRLALAAGLLQVLDFWDASHTAAQVADDLGEQDTAAYWHLIAHRREPDPGNARYWARRVGQHPIFEALSLAARPLLEAHGDSALSRRLCPGGTWSPAAMIDLTTQVQPGTELETLARRLQRLEMFQLLYTNLKALDRSAGLDPS